MLFLRAAAALLLGTLNPLAALLPLIETGPGKDSDCVQLNASLADAARHAAKTPVAPLSKQSPAHIGQKNPGIMAGETVACGFSLEMPKGLPGDEMEI